MDEDKTIRKTIREESEKLSGMTWGRRLGYIWDYYKPLMVAVLCVIFAISLGVTIYRSKQQKSLINVYMMDCNASTVSGEEMEQEFAEYLGGLGKHEYVLVDTQLITDSETTTEYSISSQVKLMAVASSGELDMMILNQSAYEAFVSQGYLMELDEILSSEQKAQWSELLDYAAPAQAEEAVETEQTASADLAEQRIYAVKIQDSEVLERYQAYGDDTVYAVLYVNAKRTDHFGDFCGYLLS